MNIKIKLSPCKLCAFYYEGRCHAYDDWLDPEWDPCSNAERRLKYMDDEEILEFIRRNENGDI